MTVKRCGNCNHPIYRHERTDLELCRAAGCQCPGFLTVQDVPKNAQLLQQISELEKKLAELEGTIQILLISRLVADGHAPDWKAAVRMVRDDFEGVKAIYTESKRLLPKKPVCSECGRSGYLVGFGDTLRIGGHTDQRVKHRFIVGGAA